MMAELPEWNDGYFALVCSVVAGVEGVVDDHGYGFGIITDQVHLGLVLVEGWVGLEIAASEWREGYP